MRYFYECGICGHLHPCRWSGDCRDDSNRFSMSDLEDMYGETNLGRTWECVPMEQADDYLPEIA